MFVNTVSGDLALVGRRAGPNNNFMYPTWQYCTHCIEKKWRSLVSFTLFICVISTAQLLYSQDMTMAMKGRGGLGKKTENNYKKSQFRVGSELNTKHAT
jgi:hypothetical protein